MSNKQRKCIDKAMTELYELMERIEYMELDCDDEVYDSVASAYSWLQEWKYIEIEGRTL